MITSTPDSSYESGYNNSISTFSNCSSLESCTLPETLTTIGSETFKNCTLCVFTNLPQTITRIGVMAFYKTRMSLEINLPNLTRIEHGAFVNTKITTVSNLGSITSLPVSSYNSNYIPYYYLGTFTNCELLTTVYLPETLTEINSYTFAGCTALSTVILMSESVPALYNVNAFKDTPIAARAGNIYVPDACVDAYKEATNWSQYADVIKPLNEYTE